MNNKTIDVIHIIDSLKPGGAERVLVDIVNGLAKQNVSVGVCITRSGNDLGVDLKNINVTILDRNSTWDLNAIIRFVKYCQNNHVKILHAHGRNTIKFAAVIKFLLPKLKLVFHDHYGNIHIDDLVPLELWLISRFFVDYYIGVSSELLDWARRKLHLAPSKSILLGNAIEISRFNIMGDVQLFDDLIFPIKAVMIANLRPQKDHHLLLEALAASKVARSKMHIFFVGKDLYDDYSQTIHKLVKDLDLEKNIRFLGTRNDVPVILNSVDFGLLSSKSESGPLVLLEYLAAGLPFIATKTGDIANQLVEFFPDFFVEPGDITGFAGRLDKMATLPPKYYKNLLDKNLKTIFNNFNITSRIDEIIKVYKTLDL